MDSNKISKQRRKDGRTLTGNNKKKCAVRVDVVQPNVQLTSSGLPSDHYNMKGKHVTKLKKCDDYGKTLKMKDEIETLKQ